MMNTFLIAALATATIALPVMGAVALSCRRPWTAGAVIILAIFIHAVAWIKIAEASNPIGGLLAIWEFLSLSSIAMGGMIGDSADSTGWGATKRP